MAYKQNNNPLRTPVLKVDMEDGVMGKANRDGTIHVNKNISDPQEVKEIVDHESVHLDQMQRGDLDYTDDKVIWKGKEYPRKSMKEGAKNLPWEKEAYQKTKTSPLAKRKNPPAFGLKEWLNKSNRVTNLGTTRPELDPNRTTGFNTPGLWSEDDKSFVEELNVDQQQKNIGTGFVGGVAAGGLAPPNVIESSTPGTGKDASASRSLVGNHEFLNDDTGSTDADLIRMSTLGDKNVQAYDDNPQYAYQDYRGSSDPNSMQDGNFMFGDLSDSADDVELEKGRGYYDVNTGEKAPERDVSARLAADPQNIFSPSSYNIVQDNSLIPTPSGGVRRANVNSGAYTTNYKLNKGAKIPDDWRGYSLKESTAVVKGQRGKWDTKTQGRKRKSGGQVFNANKKAKTLLPKRKVTYSIDSEGNQLATKRWDRKKYQTSEAFFDHEDRKVDKESFVDKQKAHINNQQAVINKRRAQQDELANIRSLTQ